MALHSRAGKVVRACTDNICARVAHCNADVVGEPALERRNDQRVADAGELVVQGALGSRDDFLQKRQVRRHACNLGGHSPGPDVQVLFVQPPQVPAAKNKGGTSSAPARKDKMTTGQGGPLHYAGHTHVIARIEAMRGEVARLRVCWTVPSR